MKPFHNVRLYKTLFTKACAMNKKNVNLPGRLIFIPYLLIAIGLISSCAKGADVSVHDITGQVVSCGSPFAGAEIELYSPEHGRLYAITDNDGNYVFKRVWNGSYTLKANKEGYSFYPDKYTVTMDSSDIQNRDFDTMLSWSKTYNETGKSKLFGIAQTLDCGYILTGYKNVPKADDRDNIEFWTAKLDLYGRMVCEKTWGQDGIDIGYSVIETTDEGFIAVGEKDVSGSPNIWVIKFHIGIVNNTLSIIEDWNETFTSGKECKGKAVFEDDNGDIIVTGHVVTDMQSDIMMMRLDNNGNLKAPGIVKYGYSSWDYTTFMTRINSTEGFIISGLREPDENARGLVLKVLPGFGEDWYKEYKAGEYLYGELFANPYSELYCIKRTSDGGYIAAGETRSANEAKSDLWVLKLNSIGGITWESIIDRGANEGAKFVYEMQDKELKETVYFIAGYAFSEASGNEDYWTLKIDTSGNIREENYYNGLSGGSNFIEAALTTKDGGHILAGWTESGSSNDYVWILKFDADGK
jgi:hypothetical protein